MYKELQLSLYILIAAYLYYYYSMHVCTCSLKTPGYAESQLYRHSC